MTTRRKPKGSLAQGANKRKKSPPEYGGNVKEIKLETDLFLPLDPAKTRDILEDAIVSLYKENGISAEECLDRLMKKFNK